jgi:hypothetical protein
MSVAQTRVRVVPGPWGLNATEETRLLILTGRARAGAIVRAKAMTVVRPHPGGGTG